MGAAAVRNDSATDALHAADDAYVNKALSSANMNALRIALFHQTHDPALAAMTVDHVPVQGGALVSHSLPRKYHAYVREGAFAFLRSGAVSKPAPTKAEAIELMTLFTGKVPTPGEIDFGYEDLAFDAFPRDVRWTNGRPDRQLEDFSVTIIGAGFSGLCAAIQLDRLGIKYRIIERMARIGGTWELNNYPEARVDISNFLYQYKFIKNYPWKSYFAPRDEIREYIDFVADKFDLRSKIDLETDLESATWDQSKKRWVLRVRSNSGHVETRETNVLISGVGLFNTPNLPNIPGIETFQGKIFHTTNWDHSYTLAGKNIGLIGTGSTGSQLLPALAKSASHVDVYQRTPNWVMPIHGYHAKVTPEKHWLMRNFPGYWNWFIYSNYIGSMQVQKLQEIDPQWVAQGGQVNQKNAKLRQRLIEFIRSEVGTRDDLFDKLVPKYAPLGRRLVIDNAFYKTLLQDNVDLVTTGIKAINPTGIETSDGQQHDHDLIVLGSGFKVSQYLWPVAYTGRNGQTLEKAWEKDGARAYLSITMPNFPNFFMFYGPTSGVRGGSFHSWTEVTTRYICQLIVGMLENGSDSVEVNSHAFEKYNAEMDVEFKKLLWTASDGGRGYFFNEHDRVVTNIPWSTDEFYKMVKDANFNDYTFSRYDL